MRRQFRSVFMFKMGRTICYIELLLFSETKWRNKKKMFERISLLFCETFHSTLNESKPGNIGIFVWPSDHQRRFQPNLLSYTSKLMSLSVLTRLSRLGNSNVRTCMCMRGFRVWIHIPRKVCGREKTQMILPPFPWLFSQDLAVKTIIFWKARRLPTRRKSYRFHLYRHESKESMVLFLRWSLAFPLALKSKTKCGPCLHIFMMFLLSHYEYYSR